MTFLLTDAIDLFNKQTAIVNNLWDFFIVVALGALGFVYSKDGFIKSKTILISLSITFLAFSAGNRSAIIRAQGVLHELASSFDEITLTTGSEFQSIIGTLNAEPEELIFYEHMAYSICVIVLLWAPFAVHHIKSKAN